MFLIKKNSILYLKIKYYVCIYMWTLIFKFCIFLNISKPHSSPPWVAEFGSLQDFTLSPHQQLSNPMDASLCEKDLRTGEKYFGSPDRLEKPVPSTADLPAVFSP